MNVGGVPDPPEPAALPSVSLTAVGVAAIRAAESDRPDRLFDDPCAAGFVRASSFRPGAAISGAVSEDEAGRRRGLINWISVRTRFLDDVVLRACAGPCRQAVILGAGLDARAFRLPWPTGTRLWELDLAEVLAFKELVVGAEDWVPRCERSTLAVDLAGDWGSALLGAGFDPATPTVWLAEGLLAYLSPDVNDALIARAAALSAPGSRFGLTLAAPNRWAAWRAAHPDGQTSPGDYVALWQSAAPEDATGWLQRLGWQAEVFDVEERSSAYGRPISESNSDQRNGARLVDATRL
jgi:methyltransferase (TIGR00027 family)